jgi:hypothetical protein
MFIIVRENMHRTPKLCAAALVNLVLLASAVAQQEDLSGHWTGTIALGQRIATAVLDLAASGSQVRGTLTDVSGQVSQIENWKLEGHQFSFDLSAEQGSPEGVHFVGNIENGEMKLHAVFGAESGPTIVLHKGISKGNGGAIRAPPAARCAPSLHGVRVPVR